MEISKIFIIGLPRTATTSVCVAMLELGFKTAHTAYTHQTYRQAHVLADTPIFCDYMQLDKQYPQAKFIYLTRQLACWLPSIRQLLNRMFDNLQRSDGGFNPILKRCFNDVFFPLTQENIADDTFLTSCYHRHQQKIFQYFKDRPNDLLTIDVTDKYSYQQLCSFLRLSSNTAINGGFQKINIGGKVTAWKKIKHPLKVESTKNGRVDKC